MRKLIVTLALCLIAQNSLAEEGVPSTSPPMPLSGGLICDTLEQAIEAIQNPTTQVDGCGILRGVRMGTVTPLPTFQHNGRVYRMVKYTFLGDPGFNPIQYGFYGRPVQIEPARLETEA